MRTDTTWPRVGWTFTSHVSRNRGIAHATPPHESTALCGMHTPYLGQDWPPIGAPWTLPYGRCASCAHRLYSSNQL